MATNRNERRERRRIAEWCGRNGVASVRWRMRRPYPGALIEVWPAEPLWEQAAWYRGRMALARLIAEFPTPEADRG